MASFNLPFGTGILISSKAIPLLVCHSYMISMICTPPLFVQGDSSQPF